MNYLKLTPEKLSIEAISDQVAHDSCGAISFFVGTTRDNFEDKKVLSLEYEAYEPMAIKQMEQICHSIRERWSDVVNIAVYHRLGLVPVREASVVIAISSPHRKTSLDAVSFAIEELKKLVPIWKKEKYDMEESAWKENKESNGRKKRIKLNFSSHLMAELAAIPRNLVQITADENEIKRRIKCFVEKKREEIDLNNIADYTEVLQRPELPNVDCEKESTCARTNSVIIKQEDSACHLRVRRVKNRIGPQIRPEYLQTLDKLMSANKKHDFKIKQEPDEHENEVRYESISQFGLHNRLSQAEEHLNITVDNAKQVYQRIKDIENRLLYLESISPEYKHFLREKILSPGLTAIKTEKSHPTQRKVFGLDELDSIIEQLKQNDSDEDDEKNPFPNNEPQGED